MEVLRAEYQREGEVSRQGQERWRDRGREKKKKNKNIKERIFNEVVKKKNRMFNVWYVTK